MKDKILKIVTNNPHVSQGISKPNEVLFLEGSPFDVLDKTEELLQQGWKLRSAPLPPNVPIMRGPYRSLAIETSDSQYDAAGLIAIDKARKRYEIERTQNCMGPGDDFAVIDKEMLERTLRDISILNSN